VLLRYRIADRDPVAGSSRIEIRWPKICDILTGVGVGSRSEEADRIGIGWMLKKSDRNITNILELKDVVLVKNWTCLLKC
jgi:hypothetical protein